MSKKTIWFRAKKYGWGWYPVTIQGWLITLLYLGLAIIFGILFPEKPQITVPAFFALTCILIAICFKYGEKPRWRWGEN